MSKEDSCYQCPDRHRACHDTCPYHKARAEERQKKKEFLNSDKEFREYNLKRWIRRQAFCRSHRIRKYLGGKDE